MLCRVWPKVKKPHIKANHQLGSQKRENAQCDQERVPLKERSRNSSVDDLLR